MKPLLALLAFVALLALAACSSRPGPALPYHVPTAPVVGGGKPPAAGPVIHIIHIRPEARQQLPAK